jgi:hypothetical protein
LDAIKKIELDDIESSRPWVAARRHSDHVPAAIRIG